ncbi:ATP-binding cassette domain-containing protein, partial [bacterium]|nr:ATP-binding cassette domain-containing protein [bacterium]
SSWLDQKAKRLAQEEKQEDKRRKQLERELDWVRMGAKGRQAKGKARLNAYEKMAGEEIKEKEAKLELWVPNGPRLGDNVIRVENVSKSFDGRVLFENLNFDIPKNAIVGIIGPNGVGKSTLFKILVGKEKPDTGTVTIGDSVKISYVDQSHEALLPEKTIYEIVSEGNDLIQVGNASVNARAYISRFNFTGADQQKKLGVCSGGERNRVHLAMTLKDGGNVLLLDEPTNDIDVNTLRALEDAIDDFAGCVLIISHDRWFLDRLATHILSFEDEGQSRSVRALEDLQFKQTDESKIRISGDSYSDWDQKVIHYECEAEVLSRGMIRSGKDVSTTCKMDGENWPHDSGILGAKKQRIDRHQLFVKLKPEATLPASKRILSSKHLFGQLVLVQATDSRALARELKDSPAIEYVEPNSYHGKAKLPKLEPAIPALESLTAGSASPFNDPQVSKIWSFLDDSGYGVSVNKAYSTLSTSAREDIIV